MVFRVKGFLKEKIIDESSKVIALIKHNLLTNDTQIFIPLTGKKYISHFDSFSISGEKNQKHIFHQYIIEENNKSISTATVSFRILNNIKSCEFDYLNKHYVINASNKYLVDKFEVFNNDKTIATACVRAFSKTVKSDEVTDPLLICIFYIFSSYINSEHDISCSG